MVKVVEAPVSRRCWWTSVALDAIVIRYVTPDSSVRPGSTTNRLVSRLFRTTRVPGTGGLSAMAASVAGAAMPVEKLTEIGVSTGTPVEPWGGVMLRIAGAGPVVNVHWWSTEFTTPLGSRIPPASVNVYEVLGRRMARGCSSVKPVSPASHTISTGCERAGAERGDEVAGWDRTVDREATHHRPRHDRSVELDGDRCVGRDPDSTAIGGELDDLGRAAEASRE